MVLVNLAFILPKNCFNGLRHAADYQSTQGASHIRAAGGKVLAQDESICADKVLPLPEMVAEITRACEN